MEFYLQHISHGGLAPALDLPASKSITARVISLDFLSGSRLRIHRHACDDERVLAHALQGIKEGKREIDLGESGTALRLLTAIIAARPGAEVKLRGHGRLMQRPMTPLLQALQRLGAPQPVQEPDGSLTVVGKQLRSSGILEIDGSMSSQFISALMMIAPGVEGGLEIEITGDNPVSQAYLKLTAGVMAAYGVKPVKNGRRISIPQGRYFAPEFYIRESDWSAASYLYEMAALSQEPVEISSLTAPALSLQGDRVVAWIFASLGVRTLMAGNEATLSPEHKPVEMLKCDMRNCPDLVPAVVATCAGLGVPFEISGVEHLRHKESDRLAAICTEFAKMGLTITGPGLRCLEPDQLHMPEEPLRVYGDHRMAMSLAPLATRFPLRIEGDREVVEKSFPAFWHEMNKLGIIIS